MTRVGISFSGRQKPGSNLFGVGRLANNRMGNTTE